MKGEPKTLMSQKTGLVELTEVLQPKEPNTFWCYLSSGTSKASAKRSQIVYHIEISIQDLNGTENGSQTPGMFPHSKENEEL